MIRNKRGGTKLQYRYAFVRRGLQVIHKGPKEGSQQVAGSKSETAACVVSFQNGCVAESD